jgi:hypothetical protein
MCRKWAFLYQFQSKKGFPKKNRDAERTSYTEGSLFFRKLVIDNQFI